MFSNRLKLTSNSLGGRKLDIKPLANMTPVVLEAKPQPYLTSDHDVNNPATSSSPTTDAERGHTHPDLYHVVSGSHNLGSFPREILTPEDERSGKLDHDGGQRPMEKNNPPKREHFSHHDIHNEMVPMYGTNLL